MSFHVPHKNRITDGRMGSDNSIGNNGAFAFSVFSVNCHAIASDGEGWEHVSISMEKRIPRWKEMAYIKNIFWDKEDCVIQYHPPEKDYVNTHDHCLHMWRKIGEEFPRPPLYMV